MDNLPIDEKSEQKESLLKGLLQAVPVAGGLISEGYSLWFSSVDKRKKQWAAEITSAVSEIERRFSILPQELENDERFTSFLMQATFIALKNHRAEKIQALRSALVSVNDFKQFSEDASFIYLRYIDELSPLHITILSKIEKHIGQIARHETLDGVFGNVSTHIPGLERTLFRTCMQDLEARFLLLFSDLDDMQEHVSKRSALVTEESANRPLQVTKNGKLFLSFIATGP